jgi:hydrogenase/urease accessory protein HupE
MTVRLSRLLLAVALLVTLLGRAAEAHELRPAYLEIRQTGEETFDVLWKVPARGELRLGLYVRLPDRCEDLGERMVYPTGEAFIERWQFRCSSGLPGQSIVIDGLSTTLTDVLVRVHWSDGGTQTVRLDAAQASFVVEASPEWPQLAAAYTTLGVEHILMGIDHLLFVLGLMLVVSSVSALVKTITAFTVAHSITLGLAVFGVVNVPAQPVDAAIALSIVFLGAEVLRARQGERGLTYRFPWIVAFLFGLLHGLGFAGALTTLGLPPDDIPVALLFFNVGVEIGQLLFVLFFLVLSWAFRTLLVKWPRWTQPLPAYALGTLAMYWFLGRFAVLLGYET